MYHGEEYIKEAEERYKTVAKGGVPDDVEIFEIDSDLINNGVLLTDLLLMSRMVSSKSEGKRMIEQNAIRLNGIKANNIETIITLENFINNELVLQKGKKQYKKIVIK